MNRAARINVAVIGALLGFAEISHGFFEALQGNKPISGLIVNAVAANQNWTRFAEGGEPAITVIPNFLVTGIMAMLIGLTIMVWSLWFAHEPYGPPVFLAALCSALSLRRRHCASRLFHPGLAGRHAHRRVAGLVAKSSASQRGRQSTLPDRLQTRLVASANKEMVRYD